MNHGLRRILARPAIYDLFQRIMGAHRTRQVFVREYVRPEVHEKILDIGCGTGEILRHLPSVTYYGLDISPDYIKAAQQYYGHRGRFLCGRIGPELLKTLPVLDKVIVNCVMHHMDDADVDELLKFARLSLRSKGRLIVMEPCFPVDGQSMIARWLIKNDRGQHVRSPRDYEALAAESFSQIGTHVRHDLLRIPYTHLIMICETP